MSFRIPRPGGSSLPGERSTFLDQLDRCMRLGGRGVNMTRRDIILAFDLYGTLLSTESMARKLGEHFGPEKGASLAAEWRKYQLEYTWRFNSMGQYEPFSAITERSLRHTLAASELSLQTDAINDLMWAYDSLSTFPDVGPALTELSATPGVKAVVFSNGTESMVSNSVGKSSDLSPYSKVFERLIVVEDARRFKPDPTVYRMLARKMGRDEADMSSLWLISSNAFDVLGARAVGMQAVWVDRSGAGWADALLEGDAGKPTAVVQDLGDVLDAIKKHADLS